MCGRFTLTVDPAELQEAFPWIDSIPQGISARYNIAPSQPVAVITNSSNNIDLFAWGLIPSWAKDPGIGSKLINARAETLAEKPAFRSAFRKCRCLILADGFFEWKMLDGKASKIPYYIQLKSQKPFAFAGLWETWQAPGASVLHTCAIITTQPNALMQPIHSRMPVILQRHDYVRWLEPGEIRSTTLQNLLQPYPAEGMVAFPVSRLVNNPHNDAKECIQPLKE